MGELHLWLVGHLLGPGPRFSKELAGRPPCCRAALEQSLPQGIHSQACERSC